jgi:hypothetical protein
MKPDQANLQEAERMAAHWLCLGNQAAEKGQIEKAERHYQRGQKWHDRMNELLGNSETAVPSGK